MCGIFGVIFEENAAFNPAEIERTVDTLFKLSESRGKEASGIACNTVDSISIVKHPQAASSLILRDDYRAIFKKAFANHSGGGNGNPHFPTCIIGHSRLVTNGGQQIHDNNQPVVAGGMVAIHNGIITNVDELWAEFPNLNRKTRLDTEILLKLMRKFYENNGSIIASIQQAYRLIEGVASLAVFFEDLNYVLLATNNGSLYLSKNTAGNAYIFASENYILKTLKRTKGLRQKLDGFDIRHIEPGNACLIDLNDMCLSEFSLTPNGHSTSFSVTHLEKPKPTLDLSERASDAPPPARIPGEGPYVLSPSFVDEYPRNRQVVAHLRRCTRCLLPETMPFIEFDEHGVCNYCNNYHPRNPFGVDALKEAVAPYRKNNGEPDCLVMFSGGRDSSFGVHFVKRVLGMNPVAYTYDWGMVTDLARRNQMRICGKLGIEHILVSADIAKKRGNIRQNVLAWLRQPELGTVPLFMAGDKQYFYYANKVSQQVDCKVTFLCENTLEITQFKSGFCGVPPQFEARLAYSLSLQRKFKLATNYGRYYLKNPAYLNSSLIDTLGAYFSYYFIPHNYYNVYHYILWDENEINSTLRREYNWETASDTNSTWRIGDGTASFYNYIYYTIAGLTENDTFRSSQIREGIITREEGLKLIEKENEPRYESFQWYCDIIGIDFESTIRTINAAKKLYPRA
jgi:glucosamine--fructose-6-phosphate aminotransferase (isomerizing)